MPFPSLSIPWNRREPAALTLGEKEQHKAEITAAKFLRAGLGWGKGPAAIPPCRQLGGKMRPLPSGASFPKPEEREEQPEEGAGSPRSAGASRPIKIFHNLTLRPDNPEESGWGSLGTARGQLWDSPGTARGHGVTSPVPCLPRLGRFRSSPSQGIRCPWQARLGLTLPVPGAKGGFGTRATAGTEPPSPPATPKSAGKEGSGDRGGEIPAGTERKEKMRRSEADDNCS